MKCRLFFLAFSTFLATTVFAQDASFSVEAYRSFLSENASLTGDELLARHAAGFFAETAGATTPLSDALYADSIDRIYTLSEFEESLVDRHGFMVTERVTPESFGEAFKDIYVSDLPVFVSTDAILHAIHMSYDDILTLTESRVLIPKLDELLRRMHDALPGLAATYANAGELQQPLSDVDVYLTTPRRLLSGNEVAAAFERSEAVIGDMMAAIDTEGAIEYPLFAENCRHLDFSQFKPRGHYTREPELERYFRAMMWLGRTEIYLSAPEQPGAGVPCSPSGADVHRQTLTAALVAELAERTDTAPLLEEIDALIEMFVGESDNVQLPHLYEVLEAAGVASAEGLLDEAAYDRFREELSAKPYAGQKILSQILFSNPMNPDKVEPASAFMLLGQRFVIDSYVTGEVVYDRVKPRGTAPPRMLPSTLDVLFALGNDAAGQLLEDDLERFQYAPHLSALRYLIDSYDAAFWDQTLYNGWLNAIRTLKPPDEEARATLPPFMQTAAWWQEKMNTQLAGWAQLRHDNLLYVKQSYSAGITCEFPYSYVEPIPEFYRAVERFAENAAAQFDELSGTEDWSTERIAGYFRYLAAVSDTLTGVAEQELAGEPLTEVQTRFLQRMMRFQHGCGEVLDGWYVRLFFDPLRAQKQDMVVADIHTAPTDENGNMVGWVVHAGTGPVNMAVMTADVPGAGSVAFVGPVLSYYEHVSTNFERLTDEEWQTAYASEPSFRPEFVNLYLAGVDGGPRSPSSWNLITTSAETDSELPRASAELLPAYPNPFRERTVIGFRVPSEQSHRPVEVSLYNVQGQRLRTLLSQELPSGSYVVEWNGLLDGGLKAASGTYICSLRVGTTRASQTVTLVR